jgi:hypothetical protein
MPPSTADKPVHPTVTVILLTYNSHTWMIPALMTALEAVYFEETIV